MVPICMFSYITCVVKKSFVEKRYLRILIIFSYYLVNDHVILVKHMYDFKYKIEK